MVVTVVATGVPLRVRPLRGPPAEAAGIMPDRRLAPAPTATVKLSVEFDHVMVPNDEPLRPSSQSSICFEDTMGTPRACAEATMASDPACTALSVCMLVVNTP